MNLKVVYFGTPTFAATVLKDLLDQKVQVVGVVTRVDKPQKRSAQPIPSPVKTVALTHHLPLLQPSKASDPQFIEELRTFGADVFIVVAYGAILRQVVLDIPRYGCYNLHAGLLPAYRGAAPIQRCIMNGATESGNTVIRMDAGMDTGDMANTTHVLIHSDMTSGELAAILASQGAGVLIKTLRQIESGDLQLVSQNPALATIASKLSKEEGQVPWDRPAKEAYAHIRGVTPAPGAWTFFSFSAKAPKRLMIRKASLLAEEGGYGPPGTIVVTDRQELAIACSEGAICLHEVQVEGKSSMSSKSFLNGYPAAKIEIVFKLNN
ncbi:Methionyl-tRNA formyltransferase,methionyl-tRNA formyltransferase,Folate-dependent phosphoribosylglycinamide formyltransferase PurN,methionyl-tRNA formyltransferase,Formyl transferase [Chlamydia serpentis]|uniref:Methionyl-tRNA formyltransferase n=1 Tax=Chlamydia serpentis TaxID=1967782 RepID=A0A2R8FBG3_9CHLA|nr:methionyl-tRNA formyltransferase [Chlamydia serpentis]SPN73769.1 Methionyl-tRNA formyltransferase,methionyl-tRNA formyltransferase,Folate-dependent phosphoribosylglycinamide formyltransferase PurN,methionyl-tRNA formyltransferase,Formyl transferase [Chlamydia serpentis]